MATVNLPCPHCRSESVAFKLLHRYVHANGTERLALQCNACAEPIIAAYPGGGVTEWAQGSRHVFPAEVQPLWVVPKTITDAAPGSTPEKIASLYTQAMAAFRRNHYDAAGPLFRRVMEVSVKAIHPEGKGSLFERINNLPNDRGVTPAMKQWAHAVRIIGRDAVHDEDLVTKKEADDMQAFVRLFLTYAFELPARINARKPADTP